MAYSIAQVTPWPWEQHHEVNRFVERLSDDSATVSLVNVGQVEPRTVTVQGGAYGEHKLLSAAVDGAGGAAGIVGDAHDLGGVGRIAHGLLVGGTGKVGAVVGRGRTKHGEFAMASGELSSSDYVGFLGTALATAASVSRLM